MAIQFVGRSSVSAQGETATTMTLSLTALTGGIDTAARAGDTVFIIWGIGAAADVAMNINTAGYTSITELYANDTNDANLEVAYKRMGTTPDTSVVFPPSGNANYGNAALAYVFRGVDASPIDVTTTTATNINTGRPTAPAITPVTAGSVILVAGAASDSTMAVFTQSGTQLSNFFSITRVEQNDISVGAGTFAWTSGAFTPVQWTGGSTTTGASWAAATIALRPEPAGGSTAGNASGTMGFTGASTGVVTGLAQWFGTASGTMGFTGSAQGTAPATKPILIGFKTGAAGGSTGTNLTIPLTALTGGSDTIPGAGDLVIIAWGIGGGVDRVMNLVTSGYTVISELYSNGTTHDTNLQVAYKVMGAVPDASVVLPPSGSTTEAIGAVINVWRGFDPGQLFDVAAVTATGTGGTAANPPAITPVTPDAQIISFGAAAAATGGAFNITDTAVDISQNSGDTTSISLGTGAYAPWVSGTFDPAAYTPLGNNLAANSWAAVTVALKPVPVSVASATGTASGSIDVIGSSTGTVSSPAITGTASGSLGISGATTGIAPIRATTSGSLDLTGSVTAISLSKGTATGSINITGVADADLLAKGQATGSIDITGSADADLIAKGQATGSVSFGGSAQAAARVNGTASGDIALVGSIVGDVETYVSLGNAAGSLELTGQSQGVSRIVATTSGSIDLTGAAEADALIKAVSSGSIAITGTSVGVARIRGTASTNLDFTGSSTGVLPVRGVASPNLDLLGSSTGKALVVATTSGSLAITGSADADVTSNAVSTGSIDLTGSAEAVAIAKATASGTIGITGAADAKALIRGSASGSINLVGSASTSSDTFGVSTGTIDFTGLATAVVRVIGAVAGAIGLTGSADADAPAKANSNGSLGLTGAADAKAPIKGATTGEIPLTGQASTSSAVLVSASGTIGLTGAADADVLVKASSTGAISFTGAADADAIVRATAAGSINITGNGAAISQIRGSANGEMALVGSAITDSDVVGSATGQLVLTGQATGGSSASISSSGSIEFTGSAVAKAIVKATSSSSIDLGTAGDNRGQVLAKGSMAGQMAFARVVAEGQVEVRATAAGSIGILGSSNGTVVTTIVDPTLRRAIDEDSKNKISVDAKLNDLQLMPSENDVGIIIKLNQAVVLEPGPNSAIVQ